VFGLGLHELGIVASLALIGLSVLSAIIGAICHTAKKRDGAIYWNIVAVWAAVLSIAFSR
jgi:hypothetical protein